MKNQEGKNSNLNQSSSKEQREQAVSADKKTSQSQTAPGFGQEAGRTSQGDVDSTRNRDISSGDYSSSSGKRSMDDQRSASGKRAADMPVQTEQELDESEDVSIDNEEDTDSDRKY